MQRTSRVFRDRSDSGTRDFCALGAAVRRRDYTLYHPLDPHAETVDIRASIHQKRRTDVCPRLFVLV